MTRRGESRRLSAMIAFCGMAAALSVVLMMLGALLAVGTYAAPLLAALLLFPVRVEFGAKAAWSTWGVAATVSLLLGLDPEASCLYLFIGWWPIVKWAFDHRFRRKWTGLLLKLLIFTAALAVMYSLLLFVFPLQSLLDEFGEMGRAMSAGFLVLLLVCLMLYDFALTPLSLMYAQRIRPKLRFLRH